MYLQRFGLSRRPFPATPDSSLYYPATSHEQALARLQEAVADDEALMLLTGATGVGKTLLAQCLLERLGDQHVTAFVTNSHLAEPLALLQALLFDLGLPYEEGSEQVLRLRLMDHVLKNAAAGKRTLFLLDEAHHLSAEILEEVRLLANLEAGQGRAVQVLLLAQPAITDLLQQPDLAALQQRLPVRPHLEAMPLEEAADYLVHQLRAAGGQPEKIVDDQALETLARATGGVPRLLNQAAHQALCLADAADMDQVDAEAALEALATLGLEAMADEEEEKEVLAIEERLVG